MNFLIILVASFLFAAQTTDNNFKILGEDPVTGTELQVGPSSNNKIRVPAGGGELEFTNDGTSFLKLGSGSGGGGGTNILENADFESGQPPSDWTATGSSTFVAETSSPLFGNQSGAWDASAAGEFLQSALIAIPEGFLGRRCQIEINYRWPSGVAGDIKLVARQFDNSAASEDDVATIDLEPTSGSNTRPAQLMFDCPDDAADTLRLRLESTANAAMIVIDDAFLGSGRNTFDISQTELMAHLVYPPTTNCLWIRANSGLGPFLTDSDCPSPTVLESNRAVNTSNDNLPSAVFDFLPKGTYKVTVNATVGRGANLEKVALAIGETNSGLVRGEILTQEDSSSWQAAITIEAVFSFTEAGPRNFQVYGSATTTNVQLINTLGGTDSQSAQTNFTIIRYPLNTSEALTLETTGAHLEAEHDQTCLWSGSGAFSDLTGDSSCNFSVKKNIGFKNVVALSDGTGVQPIINFDVPYTGVFNVCVTTEVEPPNGATITGRLQHNGVTVDENTSTSNQNLERRGTVFCGLINVGSISTQELKLQLKTSSGTGLIGSAGQAEEVGVKWIIYPIGQGMPAPIFTDLQESLASKVGSSVTNNGLESCEVDGSSGTPVAATNSCDGWVDSITDNGVGNYTINFTSGTFSNNPNCTCTPLTTAAGDCMLSAKSNTSINLRIADESNVLIDRSADLICVGD